MSNIGTWNPEEVETLKAMHSEGCSAGEISRFFNNRYSRNAVIGKIHRLGLQVHGIVMQRHNYPRTRAAAPPRVAPKPPPVKEPDPITDPGGAPLTLLSAKQGEGCRWIAGDPRAPGGDIICGHPGFPWCAFHAARLHAKSAPVNPDPGSASLSSKANAQFAKMWG